MVPADLRASSDEDLLELVKSEHHDALAILFDRYQRLVLSVALRILRDAGEAEELTQELFLEIYQRASQFDAGRGSVKAWVLQYAYHRSYNRRRFLLTRRFYDQEPLSPELDRSIAGGSGTLDRVRFEEWRADLVRLLGSLTARQRQAIELVCFEHLTLREVADRTREPFANVRHHYYRGLKKLRDKIRRLSDGGERIASAR